MSMLFPLAITIVLGAFPLLRAQIVTIHQPDVPIVPGATLPPPNAASKCDQIVELFGTLGRTTVWNLVEKVHFEGETGEPEGMVVLGNDRYFVGAGMYTAPTVSFNGSIINGTDRTPGAGTAHLLVFDGKGKRIADAELSPPGAIEYHIGGIDYDGKDIWATIAQYRPNKTAHIVRIDPRTLKSTTLFHANDHFGGIVHDTQENKLVALNWGSRNASTWILKPHNPNSFPTPDRVTRNPGFWVDYQDCKFLGHPRAYNRRGVMLCSGVTTLGKAVIGGVAIVDEKTMVPLSEVPITVLSDLGGLVTQNPMDVDVINGRLRFYFLPDSSNSTLYVLEANPNSPFEF